MFERDSKEPDFAYVGLEHMGRAFRPRKRVYFGVIDAAAFIDLVLLVIIFLLMSSSFVIQPGVTVHLPASDFVSGTQYGDMVVTLTREGMVFFNDERTSIEGLAPAFEKVAQSRNAQSLLIEADGTVQHQTLVEIYNKAMQAGFEKVTYATRIQPAAPQAVQK